MDSFTVTYNLNVNFFKLEWTQQFETSHLYENVTLSVGIPYFLVEHPKPQYPYF